MGQLIRKVGVSRNAKVGDVAGCYKPPGYLVVKIAQKSYYVHRLIWLYVYGQWPSKSIDHIDGDRSNNRVENLRDATAVENGRNQKINAKNQSGVTGVCWINRDSRWQANMRVKGKSINLGWFKNFNEAVKARKEAEKKYNFHPNHGRR